MRLRNDDGVIQAPSTFINLAVELGLIDELTHLVLAEIVKSIDLIDETFGADRQYQHQRRRQTGWQSGIHAPLCQGHRARPVVPTRFMVELTEDAFVAKTQFPGRHPADVPRARRRHLHRRFRRRLFVAVGAGRYHRRRDQDRPLLHYRTSTSARAAGASSAPSSRSARRWA